MRVAWPWGGAGLGGLTMSEEGGLEEFEESLRRGELLLQLNDGRLKGIEPRLQAIEFAATAGNSHTGVLRP